jgi:hypothetical protein
MKKLREKKLTDKNSNDESYSQGYLAPQLNVYGRLDHLILGSSGFNSDSNGGDRNQ